MGKAHSHDIDIIERQSARAHRCARAARVLRRECRSGFYRPIGFRRVRRRSTALAGIRLILPAVLAALATFATPAASQTIPTITITGGAAVTEGGNVTFTLTPTPAPSVNITVNVSVSEAAGSDFVAATDEGDTTRTISAGSSFAVVTVPTQNDTDHEPNGSVTVTVKSGTGYTVGSPISATRAVNDDDDPPVTNNAPVFTSQPTTASVAENSGANTDVVTITATDADGDTLTYSLDSTSDAVFDINGSSGAITVQSGADLDFESKSSYTATVKASDGTDSATHDVTISVTNKLEPPAAPAEPTVSGASATSVTVNWTAPSTAGKPDISGYDVQYRASGVTAWTGHAFTGTGTSTTISSLSAGTTYQVQVMAKNAEGDSDWSTAGSGDTNDPTITISGGSAVTEGTAAAFTVTADGAPGASLTVNLTVSDASGGDFVASGDEGSKTVTITAGATTASYSVTTQGDRTDETNGSVTVRVASGAGYSVGTMSSASVTVNDDDHTPVFTMQPTTASVAENSADNKGVTTVVATDADTSDTITHSLDATSDMVFDINPSTGAITVQVDAGSALDHEDEDEYTATVTASDGVNSATHNVTISVTDILEPPAAPATPTVTGASATSVTVNWTAPTNTGKPDINDYDVQFRISGATNWTSHSFTGTNTSTTISSLSAGTTYQVQVMAKNAEGDSDWSTAGSGDTNDPTITISGGSAVTEGTAAAFTVTADGAPGANLTVNLTVSDASGGDFVASGDEGSKTVTINAGATTASYSVTTQGDRTDETNGSVTVRVALGTGYSVGTMSSASVTVNDDDHTPVFTSQPTTASVPENSADNKSVVTIAATDADTGDTISYSLDATSDKVFDINSSTGAITVQVDAGSALDHEDTPSYTATVTASDGVNSATHNVTISVTDILEPPAAPATPTVTGASATSVTVNWTAPTNTGKPDINDYDVQFRISGATNWTSHSFTGTNTSTTISSLRVSTTYQVQVMAKNAEGDSDWSTAGSGDTNDPTITISGGSAVTEGTAAAFTVTADEGPLADLTVNLTVSDASGSDFVAPGDEGSKTVTINAGATTASYSVTTQGDRTDEPNGSVTVQVATGSGYIVGTTSSASVTVNDDDHTPVFTMQPTTASVAENSADNTSVTTVVATDADTGDTISYSLDATSDKVFDINTSTGAITVQVDAGSALNHEGTASYRATVTASDDTNTATHRVTISVTDVLEPPSRPARPTVARTSPTSMTVNWTAPDVTGKPPINGYDVEYVVTGTSNWSAHNFTGTGTSTTISNLRASSNYWVRVKAKNDEGASGWSLIGTSAGSENTRTISIAAGTSPVTEGTAATFTVNADEASGNSLTINLTVSDASGSDFVASGDEGSKTVTINAGATSASYSVPTQDDRTDEPNGSVTVQLASGTGYVHNDDGVHSSASVTVNDDDHSPVFTGQPTTASVAENSADNTDVVTITATDADGDAVTYSLDATSDTVFDINSSTGAITVDADVVLNYEDTTSYSATVTAQDSNNNSATHGVTISVTDVLEPPPAPAEPTVSGASATSVSVSWTAPDVTGKPPINGYDVQYRVSGVTAWTAHAFTGTGTSTTIPSLTPSTTYEVQVQASNDEGDSDWSATGSDDTNDPTITISGGSAVTEGTAAAFTVTADGAPGANLTVNLTVSDASDSDFVASGDEGSKSVTITAGATTASYSVPTQGDSTEEPNGPVTVRVASGAGYSVGTRSSASVTVNDDDDPPADDGDTTITPPITNEAPVFDSPPSSLDVAENSDDGAAVVTITATDADVGDTLSYSLDSTSDTVFDIDSSSGAITVQVDDGTALDHEATPSYAAVVTVTDGSVEVTHSLTINVTDVDEPPDAPAAPTVARTSPTSMTVNWTAPDVTGKPPINGYDVEYVVSGTSNWSAHNFTGTGTSTTISNLRASSELLGACEGEERRGLKRLVAGRHKLWLGELQDDLHSGRNLAGDRGHGGHLHGDRGRSVGRQFDG